MMQAGWRRAGTPLRVSWRRGWLYRRLLKGPLADHIVFHPHDALPRRLEDADALLRGRFRFHGQSVDVKNASIFDMRRHRRVDRSAQQFRLAAAAGCGGRRGFAQFSHNLMAPGSSGSPAIPSPFGCRISSQDGWCISSAMAAWWWSIPTCCGVPNYSSPCANRRGCWNGFPTKRRTAVRASRRPRRWRCRASAWTIHQKAGDGPGASGNGNRPPDFPRWRSCQPFAGGSAACLSPSGDGDGRLVGGEFGAAACAAECA